MGPALKENVQHLLPSQQIASGDFSMVWDPSGEEMMHE